MCVLLHSSIRRFNGLRLRGRRGRGRCHQTAAESRTLDGEWNGIRGTSGRFGIVAAEHEHRQQKQRRLGSGA
jgi:hypothetical protein